MIEIDKKKVVLKQGLIVIGIMAGLYLFIWSPFLREGGSVLDEELQRKGNEIKKYIVDTGSLPSKENFDRLEQEIWDLEDKLQYLVDFVDPKKMRISEPSTEAGLYFIEKLHNSIRKFSEEAALKEIKFPENLGFENVLPKENMVDIQLRQLEAVEIVMGVLLINNNIKISTIKPLRPVDYIEPLSKEVFYTELPVQFSINTNTEVLIKLFLGLKNARPVIFVKELHIKSKESGDGYIEARIVLSTFIVKRKIEA